MLTGGTVPFSGENGADIGVCWHANHNGTGRFIGGTGSNSDQLVQAGIMAEMALVMFSPWSSLDLVIEGELFKGGNGGI